MSNTKISGRGTSEVVLWNVWMDLDTLVAVQRRETARVLDLQGAPSESDIDPVRSSVQGILSDFWLGGGSHWVGIGIGRGTLRAKYTSDFSELGRNKCI